MADEITQTIRLTATKNGALIGLSTSKTTTLVGSGMFQNTQTIGTTAELVSFGDLAGAPSQLLIRNLDPVNFIELGGDSGLTVFKLALLAGEAMLVRMSSGTLYAKANTAAVLIQIGATEA